MSKATSGLNPVAEIREQGGDIYYVLEQIANDTDTEFVFVSVVHGPVYLAEFTDDRTDGYWSIEAEFDEGLTGDWSGKTDLLANDLGDDVEVVDVIGDSRRYLVSEKVD